jgi:hypothetical protein
LLGDLQFRLVPSLACRSVHLNELLENLAASVDVDTENHAAGDFVKPVEASGGVGTAIEIENGLEVCDHRACDGTHQTLR